MKRVTYLSVFLFAIAILLMSAESIQAQEKEKKSPVSIGADLVSRYVWRGTDFGQSPSIQPYLEFGFGDLAFGAWGAYTTNRFNFQEMDLYVNYTIADMVTIGIIDYFFPDEIGRYDYFDYAEASTGHVFETYATFNGLDKLPLTGLLAVNFYGDSDYSVYFQVGYGFSIFEVFLGAGDGAYTVEDPGESDKPGIVNVGISASKEIPITEKYGLPISASLIANPDTKAVHLVFGISF